MNIFQPCFFNKGTNYQKISWKEGEEIKPDDNNIANVLNEHFRSSVWCLADEGGSSAHVLDMKNEKDPLYNIITCFKYHPARCK